MVATQRKEVMVILSESDYLDVKLVSLIADYDVETLSNLYQPIIGYASLAIFFTLVAEAKNQKITNISSHNQLLNRLQMAPGDFVDARKRLEAVGLLKTYLFFFTVFTISNGVVISFLITKNNGVWNLLHLCISHTVAELIIAIIEFHT